MSGIVIWVDEDERIWAPERRLLAGLGYVVEPLGDATTALEYIREVGTGTIKLAILDIMLLQGGDPRFSEDHSNNGNNTGIVLAEIVLTLMPDLRPRMLFFSRAAIPEQIAAIKKKSAELGIRYLPKTKETQGRNFVQWLLAERLITPPDTLAAG